MIASLGGVDAALVVTEPSLSGIHDLMRVLEVCGHFQVPAWVCVNKWNINPGNTRRIEDYCREKGLPLIGEIPFDPIVTRAMIAERTIPEYSRGRNMRGNREDLDAGPIPVGPAAGGKTGFIRKNFGDPDFIKRRGKEKL